jgi:hypothetical protein
MRVVRSVRTRQLPLARLSDRYGLGEDGIIFLMLDGQTEVVCGRVMGLTELSKIFEAGRDTIESAASNKYDQTTRVPYEVLTVTIKI